LEIKEHREGNVIILEPNGRLDTNTSDEFEAKLVELIDVEGLRLVIDLIHVDYISSAGLRVLLMAAKKLKIMNGSIALCSMSEHIKEVFDIAGFTPDLFHVIIQPNRYFIFHYYLNLSNFLNDESEILLISSF